MAATATARGSSSKKPAPSSEPPADNSLNRFLDIPIAVGVQLDHRLISVREVLDLRVDSVIKMDRSAGENVDLLLDGLVAGNGEIVVIEDMMGLRITDLGSSPSTPKQRRG